MAQTRPNPTVASNLLSTQSALITTLTSFLTVSIHHILFLRRIYPPVSFLSTRAYNYPVRQNRHPAVCEWVQSAIDAVRDQLEKGTVEKVAMCIFECNNNEVLERWTFDLRALPVVDRKEMDTMFEGRSKDGGGEGEGEVEVGPDGFLKRKLNVADLEAQFRAVLSRLNGAAGKMKGLPADLEYSFTITIEVKENADRPVGRLGKEERKWVAAEPENWIDDEEGDAPTSTDGDGCRPDKRAKTVPVRRLEAGELRMEVWVEESKAKFEMMTNEGAKAGSV
jgi:mitotic spindle assembly checkpoint protein MAD2B